MITEHEYRLGSSCPTKILHAQAGLPRADEGTSFGEWMRSEAGKIRAFAGHLFVDAKEVGGGTDEWEASRTAALLAEGQTVGGARFITLDATCRVEWVKKDEDTIRLYCVVPKPVDLERHRFDLEFWTGPGRLRREWREHLEIMAFRIWVVQQLYPHCRIMPLFVVPIDGAVSSIEGLHCCFEEHDGTWKVNDPQIELESMRLLRVISVAMECEPLIAGVSGKVIALNQFLIRPSAPVLAYRCKKCDFRIPEKESGYERCHGELARVTPHMFDLAYMYFIPGKNGQPIANQLLAEGRVSLWDVPKDRIKGDYAHRQLMQLEGTATGREIIKSELRETLAKAEYPLHFLDIETIRSLIPGHRGGRVNELVCFQFSVHRRDVADADLVHIGWLNTSRSHPNRRFLAALHSALGDKGSVVVWTQYEEVSFGELLMELLRDGIEGNADTEWLRQFLGSGRIFDLHAACFLFYFHPRMTGRTSIKAVLPAVWAEDSPVKLRMPYAEFPPDTDPYSFLKSASQVSDGCLAMSAALDVLGRDETKSTEAVAALQRYCCVDTLAMAFIYDYFLWRIQNPLPTHEATITGPVGLSENPEQAL